MSNISSIPDKASQALKKPVVAHIGQLLHAGNIIQDLNWGLLVQLLPCKTWIKEFPVTSYWNLRVHLWLSLPHPLPPSFLPWFMILANMLHDYQLTPLFKIPSQKATFWKLFQLPLQMMSSWVDARLGYKWKLFTPRSDILLFLGLILVSGSQWLSWTVNVI